MLLYLRRLLTTFLFVACIGGSLTSAVSDALELDADLETRPSSCIRGEADFTEDAEGQREFSVEVAGFPPGDEVPVRVAGVVVGTIEINTCGVGELDFADDGEPGEAAFPENFPVLAGGERVKVGPLKGTLDTDDDSDETVLDADLFASFPSCLSGQAELEQDAEGQREFSVEVAGFKPGRSLEVKVAGVGVGTIETDDCGIGELDFADNPEPDGDETPFPENFPALTGGERVKAGPLKGKLQSED
jgi:hypothetical protein